MSYGEGLPTTQACGSDRMLIGNKHGLSFTKLNISFNTKLMAHDNELYIQEY